MKPSTFLTALALFTWAAAVTQPCLPDGIAFNTQQQIDNFQEDHPGCTAIEGDVFIQGDDITNLDGLQVVDWIDGSLTVRGNPKLQSLLGLQNLVHIGGQLNLEYNPLLPSLAGLHNLVCTGGSLTIAGCHGLHDLQGLNSLSGACGDLNILFNMNLGNLGGLTSFGCVAGHVMICGNPVLTSLAGIAALNGATIEELTVAYNPMLSSCEVAGICCCLQAPGGPVNIHHNGPGCDSPAEVAMAGGFTLSCLPYGNYYLNDQLSVDRFSLNYPETQHLKGSLQVRGPDITGLQGLAGIDDIEDDLVIDGNPLLTSLDGLEGLTSVGGNLVIGGPLEGGGGGNLSLASITSLLYLVSIGGDLVIANNPALSACAIDIVCDFVNFPAGNLEVWNNGPGCSSQAELIAACLGTGIPEHAGDHALTVRPNPVRNGKLWVGCGTCHEGGERTLRICNILGQEVHAETVPPGRSEVMVDTRGWNPGLYLITLHSETKGVSKVTVILE